MKKRTSYNKRSKRRQRKVWKDAKKHRLDEKRGAEFERFAQSNVV